MSGYTPHIYKYIYICGVCPDTYTCGTHMVGMLNLTFHDAVQLCVERISYPDQISRFRGRFLDMLLVLVGAVKVIINIARYTIYTFNYL